jgi:hypothetical protein
MDMSGGLSDDWEYVWAKQPDDPELRESVNAWIWDDSGEFGMPRIGIEAVADQWDTHDLQINLAFADGRVYCMFGNGPVHDPIGSGGRPTVLGAGPLSFEVIEPYRHLRMRLDGQAVETSAQAQAEGWIPGVSTGDLVPVQAEIDIRPAVPPWENGALHADAKHILETQEEGDLMGYPWRFEQLCRATGVITVNGERRELTGGANRIRRQSVRRLAKFWGHAWQAALFPSGRAFACLTYPPRADGKTTYNEAFVYDGDGALMPARVVQSPWLRKLMSTGDDATAVLQTDKGTITIDGITTASTFMIMPPEVGGGFTLQQALVRYTWDGETGTGMLERSATAPQLDADSS